MKVTLESLEKARLRVGPYVQTTPLKPWDDFRKTLGHTAPIYIKLENLQNTGSFKVRGAANKMLALKEVHPKISRVVAASAGNHAFVAGRLGIPATIVMPEGAPIVKAEATAGYGADVVLHGLVYDDAFNKAQEILKASEGSHYVHAYEDLDIIAGQGTAGLEIVDQLQALGFPKDRDSRLQVVIPIGGGGLVSGVGSAIRYAYPKAEIFGVVGAAAPAMAESFAKGQVVVSVGRTRTLAEGLAVKKVSQLTFEIIRDLCKEVAIVDEDEIALGISTLMERGKLVAEGSGAAGVAAALAGKIKLDPAIPTVFVICGGNIDMNMVSNILERGLTKNGRWMRIRVTVEDKPGELSKLTGLLGKARSNILEVSHDRTHPMCPVGHTMIRFHLETRGNQHAREIEKQLQQEGYQVDHE